MNVLKLDRRIGAKQLNNLFEDLAGKIRIRADHHRFDNGALPEILIARLGHRNRKALSGTREQTLKHLTLVFQRVGAGDEEDKNEMPDRRALLRVPVMRVSFQAFRPLFPGRNTRSCRLS